MAKDPNFEAQLAEAKAAATAFVASPTSTTAHDLKVKLNSVVWTN